MINTDRVQKIETLLTQAFAPVYLQVIDESDQHIGHAGHQGGGRHFAIVIQSPALSSLRRVEAHKKVYEALSEMMKNEIHALRIQIK